MNRDSIVRGAAAIVFIVLALVTGYRAIDRDFDPAVATSPAITPSTAAEAHPSFLYGRVITYDGASYEGQLRFGGDEEAFWGNYLNGFKDENPWITHVPLEWLTQERPPIEIFGIEFPRRERRTDLGKPFMVRFGDIARIESYGDGLWAFLERGLAFDPNVRVILKSGSTFDLDRLSAGDFDDGVRVWDSRHGVVDLGPRQIRTIEFLPPAQVDRVPDRLHGTVHTRQGDFTGFLQWDREEAVGSDELVGKTADGELSLRFETIRSITHHSPNSALVTLIDGREIVLSDTRKVGQGNRGIYVDDHRYGRVLVSWEAFERVDFSPGGSGPSYDDFPVGRLLSGSVTTRDGRRLTGRLVYDLDESETIETLDAPYRGVDYTVPFGLVDSIVLPGPKDRAAGYARVTLHSGEELQLERTGDLGVGNAGMLIFVDGRQRAEYVPWTEVERVDFDRSQAMYPPVGERQAKAFRELETERGEDEYREGGRSNAEDAQPGNGW